MTGFVTDSSTAGYLTPAAPIPLDDDALVRFLQAVVVGVTGLDGTLVRPRWQNPDPGRPQRTVTWCGMGITDRRAEGMPALVYGDAGDTLIRYERLRLLCSFYGPASEQYAGYLRDGLFIAQNREVMLTAGMVLVGMPDDFTHAPELLNDGWLSRTDLDLILRREVRRVYPILAVSGLGGQLIANTSGGLIVEPVTPTPVPATVQLDFSDPTNSGYLAVLAA